MDDQHAIDRTMRTALIPKNALELLNRSRDPNASDSEIARIIGSDQVIAARMLKIANSAFYGKAGKIGTIPQALMLLGRDTLTSIVLGLSLRQAVNPGDRFERELWEHSACSAKAARAIAVAARYPRPEEAYLAGLLHSLGVLVLARAFSKERALTVFGGTSNDDGRVLGHVVRRLAEWGFPDPIVEAMGEWMKVGEASSALVQVTALACATSRRLGVGPIPEPELDLGAHPSAARLGLDAGTVERILGDLVGECHGGGMDELNG